MTRPINCDQVAWMLAAIKRYLPHNDHPSVSRARDAAAYGLLYELMEVAALHFEDESAAHNGTPRDVFTLRQKEGNPAAADGMTLAGGAEQARQLGQLMRQQYQARNNIIPD